jgi:hypothetical protein
MFVDGFLKVLSDVIEVASVSRLNMWLACHTDLKTVCVVAGFTLPSWCSHVRAVYSAGFEISNTGGCMSGGAVSASRVRLGLLLASSSIAALLVSSSGPAMAACTNTIGPGASASFTNPNGTIIPCVQF